MATLEQMRLLAQRRRPEMVRPVQGSPAMDPTEYETAQRDLTQRAGNSLERNVRIQRAEEQAKRERALGVLKGNVRGAEMPRFADPDEALAEEMIPGADSLFAHDAQQDDIASQQGNTYMHVSSRNDLRQNAVDQLRQKLGLDRREHEQKIEERRLAEEGLNARARLAAEGQSKPYYTPVQTGQGVQSFDHRTGQIVGRVGDLKPGETSIAAITAGDNVLSIGDRLKSGVRPEWTGPAAGRIGSMLNAFVGDDAGRARFEAETQSYINAMIKAITGAQMSEPEALRIMRQLPHMNLPPTTYMARLDASQVSLRDAVERRKAMAYGRIPPDGLPPVTEEQVRAMLGSVGGAPGQPAAAPAPSKDVSYYLQKYGRKP